MMSNGVRKLMFLWVVLTLFTLGTGSYASQDSVALEFQSAIDSNDLGEVQALIRSGADVNIGLHAALECREDDVPFRPNRKIVRYLLSAGANANSTVWSGFSPMSAIANNYAFDPVVADMLLRHGGRIDAHALYVAAWRPESRTHLKALKWMLTNGVYVNIKDETGESAVFGAVRGDNPDAVRLLVRHGARLDIVNAYGRAPLLYAVVNPMDESIPIHAAHELLMLGADPNVRGPGGMTALMYLGHAKEFIDVDGKIGPLFAPNFSEDEVLSLAKDLVRHGADASRNDVYGHTAAQIADKHRLKRLARYLRSVEGGARIMRRGQKQSLGPR